MEHYDTGITSSMAKRVWEQKEKFVEGFAEKYYVVHLVYYELHEDMATAISREKQIKKWQRKWKLYLIEKQTPYWLGLWGNINR